MQTIKHINEMLDFEKEVHPYDRVMQEEICENKGREARYQIMPLDEDGKPSRFFGTDESPIDQYAIVDMKNRAYRIIRAVGADDYSDAREFLSRWIISEEEQEEINNLHNN
jgi:hypothetical protein